MVVTRSLVPVPAIPPTPYALSLVAQGNQPPDTTGRRWTGGYQYLPESKAAAILRDVCDFTAVDGPALSAPTVTAAGTPSTTGGTLAAGLHTYEITSTDGNGETTASTAITATTTGSTGSVSIAWADDPEAGGYKVYGRTAGSLGLLATVGGNVNGYTDVGTPAPGAAPPGSNSTGGPVTGVQPGIVQEIPFIAVVDEVCSSFGWEAFDYVGRAERHLQIALAAAIEKEFWTGALATTKNLPNDFLANSATCTVLSSGTPVSITRGIQLLEDYNATVGLGAQAMIHVQPEAVPSLLNARRVQNFLLSEVDNIIVPGAGYTGTGPGNTTPTTGMTWIYITDMVNVRLDEPQIIPDNFAEAMDWGQMDHPNTITFRGEQIVGVDFAGIVHAGIQVNLAT